MSAAPAAAAAAAAPSASSSAPLANPHAALFASYPSLSAAVGLLQDAAEADASPAADTRRMAALLIVLAACEQGRRGKETAHASEERKESIAEEEQKEPATASKAKAPSPAAVAVDSPHPLHALLPLLYSLLHPFLLRMLSSPGLLPPGSRGPGSAATSYASLAIQGLAEVGAHGDVARLLAGERAVVSSALRTILAPPSADSSTSGTALALLAHLARSGGPALEGSVSVEEVSALLDMVPSSIALASNASSSAASSAPALSAAAASVLPLIHVAAWLVSSVPAAKIAKHLERTVARLSGLFESDQGRTKFALMSLLVAAYSSLLTARDRAPGGAGSFAPMTPAALSLRVGLSSLLGSKLDALHRLQSLRLSRLLLQFHGPVFATSSPTPSTPLIAFLQLLSNQFTIELRLALDEFASTREQDLLRVRGEAGRVKRQVVLECLQLFNMLTTNLTGDDEDVESDARALQWWNLPVPLLMHFKKRMDECIEAILTTFAELQAHPEHPRDPRTTYESARALAQWMAEDTESQLDAIVAVLPLVLSIVTPADDANAASASSGSPAPSILSCLLPSLLFLASNERAQPILVAQRVPQRLVEEIVLPEVEQGVRGQQQLLRTLSTSASAALPDANEPMESERAEMRRDVLAQLSLSLARVANACDVAQQLLQSAAVSETRQQLQPRWKELQPALKTAQQLLDQERELHDAVGDESTTAIQAFIKFTTRRLGA